MPDALSADGTPIDLRLIETPTYIQAGREDHIAPPESVLPHARPPHRPGRFVLAGPGISPAWSIRRRRKIPVLDQRAAARTLDEFVAGATEHKGSWWPTGSNG